MGRSLVNRSTVRSPSVVSITTDMARIHKYRQKSRINNQFPVQTRNPTKAFRDVTKSVSRGGEKMPQVVLLEK